jgi:hypothetical protein
MTPEAAALQAPDFKPTCEDLLEGGSLDPPSEVRSPKPLQIRISTFPLFFRESTNARVFS